MLRTTIAACLIVACGCNNNALQQETALDNKRDANPFQSKKFAETGDWITWSDKRISIRIPKDWTVDSSQDQLDESRTEYEVKNDKRAIVINMMSFAGGPKWDSEFSCIPEEQYSFAKTSQYKFWQIMVDMLPSKPGGRSFGFKVASANRCLSGSATLPDGNASAEVIYSAQSALTIE